MLEEVVWELTMIHENKKITTENVSSWAKRVNVKRAQSAIMNSLTETKELNKLKLAKSQRERNPQNRYAGIVVAAIPQDSDQHMGRHAQNSAKLVTSKQCAEAEEPQP